MKLLTKGELVRRPGHTNSAACSSQLATPAAGKPRSSLPHGAIPAGCSAAQRGARLRGRDGVCKTPRRRLLGEDRSSPGWARALTLSTPQPPALPLPASLRPCPATTALTSPGQRAVGRMGAVWARAFEASAKASWKPAAGVGAPTRFAGRHPPVSRVSQLPSHASGPPATFERETLGFSPVPSPCIHQRSPPCRRPSREDPAGSLAGVARPSPLPPPCVLLPQVPG